jgi:DNA-binding GntR family transcriptional regulator
MKIVHPSLTQIAVGHLRNLIIGGELPPGQKINETLLASKLGLSRPPFREALRILEAEGLVISNPRRSAFVVELSLKDWEAIHQVRGMIECYAVDLIELRRVKDFSQITNALTAVLETQKSFTSDLIELLDNLKLNTDFHFKLVECAGNPYLDKYYRTIRSNLARYQLIGFLKQDKSRIVEEHTRILAALKRGAFEEAKKQLLSHVRCSFERMNREGNQFSNYFNPALNPDAVFKKKTKRR